MKERPIIFNGEMVRAILDGRKTQTRRLVPAWQLPKHYPDNTENPRYNWMATAQRHSRWGYGVFGETEEACANELSEMAPCPFGCAGNRLWVRETFRLFDKYQECGCSDFPCNCPSHNTPIYRASNDDCEEKWTPSIHMPRKSCRLVLELISVRVERLNDISEEDALAEGFVSTAKVTEPGDDYTGLYASDRFSDTWEKIYGQKSWLENPWVWVIEFRRLKP